MTGPSDTTRRRERIITAYLDGWGGGDLATFYAAQETCRDIGLRPARTPRERDPEGWLTIKQAAARLNLGERTLREHMRRVRSATSTLGTARCGARRASRHRICKSSRTDRGGSHGRLQEG